MTETPDKARGKLIQAKQDWAKQGRGITGRPDPARANRLPPGQRLTNDWPVLDLGTQPEISTHEWTLSVDGAVQRPLRWSWQEMLAQPQVELVSDIHCVTSWSRYDNRWRGVTARHLLDLVGPTADAHFVMLHSFDGYTTNLPLDRFAAADVLLAHAWNGEPLPREHGGPVRLVVPQLYFWKSAKWLRRISFMAEDKRGYWEERSYHDVGDPWLEERYQPGQRPEGAEV